MEDNELLSEVVTVKENLPLVPMVPSCPSHRKFVDWMEVWRKHAHPQKDLANAPTEAFAEYWNYFSDNVIAVQ